MLKKAIILGIALAAAAGAFLMFNSGHEADQEKIDVKKLVNQYSTGKFENETASITSHELIVTKGDGNEVSYKLPSDDFFLSIAPYMNETHPCAIHNLTGCQGEMVNKEFAVLIEDEEGNIIVDEMMKSESNGFIDVWVPRDRKYNITIEHNDRKAETEISSFEGDDTCITTMKL